MGSRGHLAEPSWVMGSPVPVPVPAAAPSAGSSHPWGYQGGTLRQPTPHIPTNQPPSSQNTISPDFSLCCSGLFHFTIPGRFSSRRTLALLCRLPTGYQPLQLSVTWPWRCGFSRSSGGNAGSMGIPRLYETRDITQTMPRLRRSLSFTPQTNSNPRPVHCRVVKVTLPPAEERSEC